MNVSIQKRFLFAMTLLAMVPSVAMGDGGDDADRRGDDGVVVINKIKAHKGFFDQLCAEQIKNKRICTDHLIVNRRASADSLCVRNFGADLARIDQICGLYRATSTLSANTLYNLGAPVNFDVIVDDPANDVTLAPFQYHASVSGYYIVTVQIDASSLVSTTPILGIPISNLEIHVNGAVQRQAYNPFLGFFDQQRNTLTALISLQAGDIVTVHYNVLILSQATGIANLVGTVLLHGNGNPQNTSLFKIHYLSSDCRPAPECQPEYCDNSCVDHCKPCH